MIREQLNYPGEIKTLAIWQTFTLNLGRRELALGKNAIVEYECSSLSFKGVIKGLKTKSSSVH